MMPTRPTRCSSATPCDPRERVLDDDNPTAALFLLAGLERTELVRPALDSDHDTARTAAKKLLAARPPS